MKEFLIMVFLNTPYNTHLFKGFTILKYVYTFFYALSINECFNFNSSENKLSQKSND
jgi:hypothetical protein